MNPDNDQLPDDLCPAFQTKTMFLNTEYRKSPEQEASVAQTAHFWCHLTQSVFGPDEDDVEPERCIPGRSCYCRDQPEV